MGDPKFTPGPWVTYKDLPTDVVVSKNGDCSLATLDCGCGGKETMRANANLIAAAPDLYEAIVSLIDSAEYLLDFAKEQCEFMGDVDEEQGFINKGRAALAKARGETP
ncbi:hypothetical protein [Acetobacter cerevisiae]|uniref:hypothetical protein n=1 Tax=Acetobacter cerevisiae TaxID=178900 RepID=UPI0020A019DF|nr:hypothetical protein [Acetobacter cerevisiae]MCP1271259.1 hypothetical protein [Acetobacter cerevisiae]MCP1279213.1 hypothetical protein [Acetobacter cerevisiae]